MLILLFGPSGAGKSTVANLLVEKHSWLPVISWLTRPERPDELFKISISSSSFDMLAKQGKFWSDVEQNNFRYGLLWCEIRQAIDDPKRFYVLDYSLSSWKRYFADEPTFPVYLGVSSEASLAQRLVSAGRSERLAGALDSQRELDAWHKEHSDVIRILNHDGCAEQAAAEVATAASAWVDGAGK